jgi:hypothetical protein
MTEKRIIRKVWQKSNGQLMVSIPTSHKIGKGDFVEIKKI